MTDVSVLVIGLGSMGFGMAQSCLHGGLATYGVDTNAEAEARFAEIGGALLTANQDLDEFDVAVVVVLNAAQLNAVLFGPEGIVPQMRAGSVVIACPTVAPSVARKMAAQCADSGVHYLDAPISGGSVKAAEGKLSIMASGSTEAFAAARPVLNATSTTVFELGTEPGKGSAMKAVNQLLAGVHIATMGEAMAFSMTQGIAPQTFLDVISQCVTFHGKWHRFLQDKWPCAMRKVSVFIGWWSGPSLSAGDASGEAAWLSVVEMDVGRACICKCGIQRLAELLAVKNVGVDHHSLFVKLT